MCSQLDKNVDLLSNLQDGHFIRDRIHYTSFSQSITNLSNKLKCYITQRLTRDKSYSLLGQLVNYKQNEVL